MGQPLIRQDGWSLPRVCRPACVPSPRALAPPLQVTSLFPTCRHIRRHRPSLANVSPATLALAFFCSAALKRPTWQYSLTGPSCSLICTRAIIVTAALAHPKPRRCALSPPSQQPHVLPPSTQAPDCIHLADTTCYPCIQARYAPRLRFVGDHALGNVPIALRHVPAQPLGAHTRHGHCARMPPCIRMYCLGDPLTTDMLVSGLGDRLGGEPLRLRVHAAHRPTPRHYAFRPHYPQMLEQPVWPCCT